MEVVRATLPADRLSDVELAALAQVLEELASPANGVSEQVAAVLVVPVVDALRKERRERSAGRGTESMSLELRVPKPMRPHLGAFFEGLVGAIHASGCNSMASVLAPLVAAIRAGGGLSGGKQAPGPQTRKRYS